MIGKRQRPIVGWEKQMTTRTGLWSVSVLLSTLLFTAPAAALNVVACVSAGSTPLQLTDDPRSCPSDRRIDAVSVAVDFKAASGGGGGGGGTAQATPSDLKLAKRLDGTSGTLFLGVVTGTRLRNLLVAAFDNDHAGSVRRVFTILLTEVAVTEYNISAEDAKRAGLPTEVTSFNYARFQLRDDQTGQTTGFDFQTNQPI
jgi:type VI protein secretion system component Hcp